VSNKLPYKITRRPSANPCYDVKCLVCEGESKCWDYRRNAYWAACSHMQAQHPEVKYPRSWGPALIAVDRLLNPGPWKGANNTEENAV